MQQAGVVTGKNLRALMADAKKNKVSTAWLACRGRQLGTTNLRADQVVKIERSRPDSPLCLHTNCSPLRSYYSQTAISTRSPLGPPPSYELAGVGSG